MGGDTGKLVEHRGWWNFRSTFPYVQIGPKMRSDSADPASVKPRANCWPSPPGPWYEGGYGGRTVPAPSESLNCLKNSMRFDFPKVVFRDRDEYAKDFVIIPDGASEQYLSWLKWARGESWGTTFLPLISLLSVLCDFAIGAGFNCVSGVVLTWATTALFWMMGALVWVCGRSCGVASFKRS